MFDYADWTLENTTLSPGTESTSAGGNDAEHLGSLGIPR